MNQDIVQIRPRNFPALLKEITDPPKTLYARGNTKLLSGNYTFLTVVGSRNCTSYGKDVVRFLIEGLKGHNICIVSGLALGIDGLAHEAALRVGLPTIAIPGSGLDDSVLYPKSHRKLAHDILERDGLLLSEYEPTQGAALWTFPKRNRLLVGISHAVLVIEAKERSGSLITARLTTDYNRDLLVVPGSIFAPTSAGVHRFLNNGATAVTSPQDIVHVLTSQKEKQGSLFTHQYTAIEEQILSLLPLSRDDLLKTLDISVTEATIILSKLELNGVIIEERGMLSCTQ